MIRRELHHLDLHVGDKEQSLHSEISFRYKPIYDDTVRQNSIYLHKLTLDGSADYPFQSPLGDKEEVSINADKIDTYLNRYNKIKIASMDKNTSTKLAGKETFRKVLDSFTRKNVSVIQSSRNHTNFLNDMRGYLYEEHFNPIVSYLSFLLGDESSDNMIPSHNSAQGFILGLLSRKLQKGNINLNGNNTIMNLIIENFLDAEAKSKEGNAMWNHVVKPFHKDLKNLNDLYLR